MARTLLPVLVLSLAGCGTMTNLSEKSLMGTSHVPYGGTIFDGAAGGVVLANAFNPKNGFDGEACLNRCYCMGVGSYLLFVDMPLSFVGDTVTLPYVLCTGPKTVAGGTLVDDEQLAPGPKSLKPASTKDLLAPKREAKEPSSASARPIRAEPAPASSGFAVERTKR